MKYRSYDELKRLKLRVGVDHEQFIREAKELEKKLLKGGGELIELKRLKQLLRLFYSKPYQYHEFLNLIRKCRVKYYVFIYKRKKRVFIDLRDFMVKVVFNNFKPRKEAFRDVKNFKKYEYEPELEGDEDAEEV